LLGDFELHHLLNYIEKITGEYRTCTIPERNKLESAAYKLIVKGMSAILGELFQNDPKTLDQIFSQFGIVIDKDRSFLSLLPEKMEELCRDPEKWHKFLLQLESVKENFKIIQKKTGSRIYIDIQGKPYYWVYPEELFPPIN
jgi:hypothetical protein